MGQDTIVACCYFQFRTTALDLDSLQESKG